MDALAKGQQHEMRRTVVGLKTKADKIRALDRAGFKRSEISRFLEIRYQHVRNVLVRSHEKAVDEPSRRDWAQVGPDGRIVIPAQYRRLLDIENGGPVLMLYENGEVRLVGRDAAVRRAQSLVARYASSRKSLVDELLAERRAESAREDGNEQGRP